MPRTINKAALSGKSAQPQISAKLLEELIPGPVTKEQFEDIFHNFKKAFIERALNAEMSHHLGYGSGQVRPSLKGARTIATAAAPRRCSLTAAHYASGCPANAKAHSSPN